MKTWKQISLMCICAVLSVVVTACNRGEASGNRGEASSSRGEAKPQTQTESETSEAQTPVAITADSYAKILNGDLSDFTGKWFNYLGEGRLLKADGTSESAESPAPDSFRLDERGYYIWEVLFEEDPVTRMRYGYVIYLLPPGVDVAGWVETHSGTVIMLDILPTDNTKERIVYIQNDSPSLKQVYYREFISTVKQQYFIRSNADFEGYGKTEMEILQLDTNPYTAIEMIGWSNNGLFAYRTKHLHDSGMWGGWIYSLIVINTVTDEIIERESFIVGDTANDEYLQDVANNLNAALLPEEIHNGISKEYIAKWNTKLRNYKISGELGNPIAGDFVNNLLKFPINNYNCWFDDFKVEKNAYKWLLIIGNESIQKIISEGKDELYADMHNINGRKILGYYKSPYENRIVVATIYYDWIAFSGGYHTVKLDLFGCNMNVGLTK